MMATDGGRRSPNVSKLEEQVEEDECQAARLAPKVDGRITRASAEVS